jgi:two-component system sensor histidine kinase VicK
MTNLMSNAIKFSPDGGEVQIMAELINNIVRISIKDQGSGIPHNFIAKYLQNFLRQILQIKERWKGLVLD